MKKPVSKLLLSLLTVSLVACSSPSSGTKSNAGSVEGATSSNSSYIYQTDPETLDYLVTQFHPDAEVTTNLVDTLMENDRLGNLTPALAESYQVSEDGKTYTFKLRKGVKWVTSTGEEYAETKAQDFVTALQHAADFKSDTIWLVEDLIVNMNKYVKGEVKFEEVGVKATDDYTLVYTLNNPAPYFLSMTTYGILQPINKEFLESKGAGCKLGAPKPDDCQFGTVTPDSILYNGIFILDSFEAKSKISYRKNASYWDKDNVHFDTLSLIYTDGKDPYSVIKGFERGTYIAASLSPVWKNFKDYQEKYKDNYIATEPNATVFGTNLNYNRVAHNLTKKNAEQLAATEAAKHNKHFRLALQHAIDRVAYNSISSPADVAKDMLVNLNTFDEVVFDSKGNSYEKLVSAAYSKLTGKEISLAYGQDPFLSKEAALAEIELAKKDGVKFPVTLDLPVISDGSEVYLNRGRSFKESVEKNTDGQILIEIQNITKDQANQMLFREQDPTKKDYDINNFVGWTPDYADPKSASDTFSVKGGSSLRSIGLQDLGKDAKNDEILNKIGLVKYTELIEKADAEYKDLDKRYQLYAEAEAFLLSEGLYMPFQMQLRGYLVTKIIPKSGCYGLVGNAYEKWKFKAVQNDIVTKSQYAEAYQKWTSEKAASDK